LSFSKTNNLARQFLDWHHLVGAGLGLVGELLVDDRVEAIDVLLVGGLDGRTL
jgi:hypothetical protein